MAEVVQRERTVRVKIVYYGPALGGKTTNLRSLGGMPPAQDGSRPNTLLRQRRKSRTVQKSQANSLLSRQSRAFARLHMIVRRRCLCLTFRDQMCPGN